jgi:uncharacterized protein (TIGR02284 family)
MSYKLNEDAVKGLNHLLTRNKDAANGFVEVANNITYPKLTKWLIDWAKVHEQNSSILQGFIEKSNAEADPSTSLLGELHHAWIDIKAQLTNDDTVGLLDECLTGQEKAIKDYDDIIKTVAIPVEIKGKIRTQRDLLNESIKDLKFMKNSMQTVEQ